MKTDLCQLLGIELPIIQAPMGGAVGPALAAAVSNAGGLGMLAPWRANIDMVRQQIRETRTLTPRPFGVNLNLEFPQEERLVTCLDERVPAISFFWRDPSSLVIEAATHASNETSEKVRAAFTDMLANGYRVGGSGRLFGFEILCLAELDDYWDDEDGERRFTGPAAVVRQEEAGIVRELARRLLDGETADSIADDLNGRGITTTRGGAWEARNLFRTLGNPLYGGRLAYKGEIIGRLAGVEPILDEDSYQAVQAKLGARKRGRKATGRVSAERRAIVRQPGVRQARHDGGRHQVQAADGRPRIACLHLRGAGQGARLRAVGARRPRRGHRAGPGAGGPGRRGAAGGDAAR